MLAGIMPGIGISVAEVNSIVTMDAELPSGLAGLVEVVKTEVVRVIGLAPVQVVAEDRLILLVNWS